ncbi:MAG: bis(5'-nucleosyl)-tetraphosphatase (symmetrical) YqeK [Erysipelotrichaceae bacterium]|jgi:nicotinate-nucleotide adenylyltransferase
MRIAIYKSHYDPITNYHIQTAKKILKEKSADLVCFYVDNSKDSDTYHRQKMVKLAIKPYRKFVFINNYQRLMKKNKENEYFFIEDNEGEKKSTLFKTGKISVVDKKVCSYIFNNGIYAKEMMSSYIGEKRMKHCLSVADLCVKIARGNRLDEYKAYLIGLYHDIAKDLSEEELSVYINIYKPYEINYDYPVWHQYVGYYYLKHCCRLKNKKMLKAIRHHCLGDDNDVYSKLIFVADKLDPLRSYDSSQQIEIACRDLNKAFEVVKKQNQKYLESRGIL